MVTIAALVLLACGGRAPDVAAPSPALELAIACDAELAALDRTLLADEGSPGEVLACAREGHLDARALEAVMRRAGALDVEALGGAHVVRVVYETTRRGGERALASARALVPDRATDRRVVVAHPTVGLADGCAPSRRALESDALVVPWAARGWAAIAPDYAGLGTPGTQGYGDGDDTARSTLDAARALGALTGSSARYVVVGHSQGGGAALSAQALARSYGPEGMSHAIAIAPGWPVRASLAALRDPARRTRGGRELSAVIGAMALYAWHAQALGEARAGEGFPPDRRAAIVRALERECIGSLVTSIPDAAPSTGALVEPSLREGLLACEAGGACGGRAADLWAFVRANVLHGDPAGAPITIAIGADDALITPARTACVVDHLRADGVAPRVCLDAAADHVSIVPRSARSLIALAEGGALACAAELPPCALE